MKAKSRIGILTHDLCEWAGGRGLLRGILNGLVFDIPRDVEIILFIRLGQFKKNIWDKLCKAEFKLKEAANESETPEKLLDFMPYTKSFKTVFFYGDDLGALLKHFKIDAHLPVFASQKNGLLPEKKITYIYDFQHEYFPSYFTSEQISIRRRDFHVALETAAALLLTSKTVAQDVDKFWPANKLEKFILPLYPLFHGKIPDIAIEIAKAKYGIVKPYFIVCNQFWRHKDHKTVFAAFQKLIEDNVELVCTGVLSDSKDSAYNQEIAAFFSLPNVKILGVVPKQEQIALMLGAQALIQPSLFEGGAGGGAVAEALAYGVACLVSDIPIHRELPIHRGVYFFKPQRADELFTCIKSFSSMNLLRASEEDLSLFRENCLKETNKILRQSIQAVLQKATREEACAV